MLRKILMLVMIMVMTSMGAASAAEKTYTIPDGGCSVSLPENYLVVPVERPVALGDELGVKVSQLSASDPADKSLALHIMVESSKLTQELPDLDYTPGAVMRDYFTENLQNSGWLEPAVTGSMANGKIHFVKFRAYIADSAGQKYDGEIYATVKGGKLFYLMLMSRERALKPEERELLAQAVSTLQFAEATASAVVEG